MTDSPTRGPDSPPPVPPGACVGIGAGLLARHGQSLSVIREGVSRTPAPADRTAPCKAVL